LTAAPPAVETALASFAGGRPVERLESMPGNAGFSYGFEIEGERFVLRVPPPGARAEGPADVLRQAHLLRLLATTSVPVPAVLGEGAAAEPWFVVERLAARTIRPTGGSTGFEPTTAHELALATVDALVSLHAVEPPAWLVADAPTVAEAIARWDGLAARAADPALLHDADVLRGRLLATAPAAPRLGLVHGDFQWGNVLAGTDGRPRVAAVIDWELAHVGPVLDDLGWLCLFSDAGWWEGDAMPIPDGVPAPAALIERYGVDPEAVTWHLALAAYAFAVVIGFNLMLHRRGKRVDPYWEELGPSAPRMISRALELLA
jgi:aminoglycoside phosphotransferase (APT) family kinase protein